jgi:hypothetical protein
MKRKSKRKSKRKITIYQIDEKNCFYDMSGDVMDKILFAKSKLETILLESNYDGSQLSELDEIMLMSFSRDEKSILWNLFHLEISSKKPGYMSADKDIVDGLLSAKTCPWCVVEKFSELSVAGIEFVKQVFFNI